MTDCSCVDLHDLDLKYNKENDATFVTTKAVATITKSVIERNTTTIIGKPGIGKTSTIIHVALKMRKNNGYRVILCHSPSDIEAHFRANKTQLFVLDDVCGRYTINQSAVEEWMKHEQTILRILRTRKVKLLISCRLQIYHEKQFQLLKFFTENFYNLSSEEFCLSAEIRLKVAKKYLPVNTVKLIDKNSLMKFDIFPLMCSLYKNNPNIKVSEYFENPYNFYLNDIEILKNQSDKRKFCALLLYILHNGFLSESKISTTSRSYYENIFDEIGLNRGTPICDIVEQLDTLDHTYLIIIKSILFNERFEEINMKVYSRIHDRLFDVICFYFGTKVQGTFIRYVSSAVLCERTQLESIMENHEEFQIMITNDNEHAYMMRIMKDIGNGEISSVVNNHQMKFPKFRKILVTYMQKSFYLLPMFDIYYNTFCHDLIDREGNSIASLACSKGYVEITEYIINAIHNVDLSMFHKNLIMHTACRSGSIGIVQVLLEKGIHVNSLDIYGQTPILISSDKGHGQIVHLLMKNGGNIRLQNEDGMTPLLCASKKGHYSVVKILLDNKADINEKDNQGKSPLIWTSKEGHDKTIELLIENGANINLSDRNSKSPLMWACQWAPYSTVMLLIEKGTDINQEDSNGWTPIIYACQWHNNSFIVEFLILNGADIRKPDNAGRTPLMWAGITGNNSVIDKLIEQHCYINEKDNTGKTTIYWACLEGQKSTVDLLFKKGADINITDNAATSPISWALQHEDKSYLRLLRYGMEDKCY
ncbi:unnamed protein product [Mytilus coruscus]|uniref:Novel STAND NTPase 3 domain-containing protein n=1 Tax=Mytilus coruscus TaxID=42192 RepID=A0A6J8ATY2_MYTCO|nr:unnamed protein product [Mytilus coruscus]